MQFLGRKFGITVIVVAFVYASGGCGVRLPLKFGVGPYKKGRAPENKVKNFSKTYTYRTELESDKRFKNSWNNKQLEKQLNFLHNNLMRNQYYEYETIQPREASAASEKEAILMSIAKVSFRDRLMETLSKQLKKSNETSSLPEPTTASPVLIENFEVFKVPSNVFLQFTTTTGPLQLPSITKYPTFDTVKADINFIRYKEEYPNASTNEQVAVLNDPSNHETQRKGPPVLSEPHLNPYFPTEWSNWLQFPPQRPRNPLNGRKHIAEAVHQINLSQGVNKTYDYDIYRWYQNYPRQGLEQGTKQEEMPWSPMFVSSVLNPSKGHDYVTQGWQPLNNVQVTGTPNNYRAVEKLQNQAQYQGSTNLKEGSYQQPQDGAPEHKNHPYGGSTNGGPLSRKQGWTPRSFPHVYSGWGQVEGALNYGNTGYAKPAHINGWVHEEAPLELNLWTANENRTPWNDGSGSSEAGYKNEHSLEIYINKLKNWWESLKIKVLNHHHKPTDKDSYTVSQKVYGKSISIMAFIAFAVYVLLILFQSALATLSIPFLSTIAGILGGGGGSQIFELLAGVAGRRRLQKYKAELNLNQQSSIGAQEDFIDLERKVTNAFEFFTSL